MNLVPALLGSLYVWRWSTDLFGAHAGIAALAIWAFCPNQLAWSASICPDLPAAALALAANYHFRTGYLHRRQRHVKLAGVMTGLAILAKSTYLLLPLVYLLQSLPRSHGVANGGRQLLRLPAALLHVTAIALLVVNVGYGCEQAGCRWRELPFRSRALTGAAADMLGESLNQMRLGSIPVPLPANFLLGIDQQLLEFELGKRSYLCGTWRESGWWHYYLVCAACKLPLGYLGLIAMAVIPGRQRFPEPPCAGSPVGQPSRWHSTTWELLAPVIVYGTVVSSQTGFSHHFRYAFPCLPYLYVFASRACRMPRWSLRALAPWIVLLQGVAGSLATWPRCHSFFNAAVGGPQAGHRWLLESNLDWGHDLTDAATWIECHSEARPIFHAVITDNLAARMPLPWQPAGSTNVDGWYIVSTQRVLDPLDDCYRLASKQPVAEITPSLRVYRCSPSDSTAIPLDMPSAH
jgi:hypothetical protein